MGKSGSVWIADRGAPILTQIILSCISQYLLQGMSIHLSLIHRQFFGPAWVSAAFYESSWGDMNKLLLTLR